MANANAVNFFVGRLQRCKFVRGGRRAPLFYRVGFYIKIVSNDIKLNSIFNYFLNNENFHPKLITRTSTSLTQRDNVKNARANDNDNFGSNNFHNDKKSIFFHCRSEFSTMRWMRKKGNFNPIKRTEKEESKLVGDQQTMRKWTSAKIRVANTKPTRNKTKRIYFSFVKQERLFVVISVIIK